jgi:type VI secretion system lysozyme-like protein
MGLVSEEDQVILSVLDNIQRILNSRAGAISHLPDYGLPDMTKILQGMPGTAHQLTTTLSNVLLKFEPRLQSMSVTLLSSMFLVNEIHHRCGALKVSGWCDTVPNSCLRVRFCSAI